MSERWARAEERYRQKEAERRYKRRAPAPTEPDWDGYDDETRVIPRYDDELPGGYAEEPYRAGAYPGDGVYPDEEPGHADPEHYPDEQPPRRPARRPRPATERGGEPRRRDDDEPPARGRRGPGRSGRKSSRIASRKAEERKRRRRNFWVIGAVFTVLVVAAVGYVGSKLFGGITPAEDFAGPGGEPVVVEVKSGDTATQIAAAMYESGAVASSAAFYEAAVQNSAMSGVQPGFYAIASRSPAKAAVAELVGGEARVGNVVISEGRQLHDQHDVNTGSRKEGIYTKIAAASCIGTTPKCVTYQELDAAGASADLAALGVPEWARAAVSEVPDRQRQLEGLIMAGSLDFDPSGTPQQILAQLVSTSARSYEAAGLLESGSTNGLTPYETLIAASLVEREALPQDMGKVARVIVNRLEVGQPLQFDSTVNYALDKTEVATTDADRATKTPWNTYAMAGLPATPISSPSLDALKAMEKPTPGVWLYFVTIDMQGTTLFTESYAEHLRNIDRALESGILDSGR
ncbi:endolytic transglycosylase MltG [Nocardia sp. NPDC057353]|uniref:endolytic transglycosylase MltG n=1 Tax=Nocardia sp. NPDC057353 TaxID=3346104 RepID=UPI0036397334